MTQTPDQAIQSWIRLFANKFLENRQADILKRGLLNTNDLSKSLDVDVNSSPETGIHFMVFFAKEYGRLQDLKRRYTKVGGEQMVADLKEWAENEGLENFSKKGKKGKKTEVFEPKERTLNRIAWGIIRKYKKKGTAPKRSWWNKGKTRDIDIGYDLLLRVWRDAVAEQHKRAFK